MWKGLETLPAKTQSLVSSPHGHLVNKLCEPSTDLFFLSDNINIQL